jgi:hypothetical protein
MATLKTWREPGLNWQVTVFRKLVQVRRWANIPYGPINAVRAAGVESRRQNLSVCKQAPKARCHLAFRRGRDQEPEATPPWKTDEITARLHCTSFGNYNPIRRCYCWVQFTIKVTQLLGWTRKVSCGLYTCGVNSTTGLFVSPTARDHMKNRSFPRPHL